MITKTKLSGFSRKSQKEKRQIIAKECLGDLNRFSEFEQFHFSDADLQQRIERFSENTLTNHVLPFGVIPNVVIDGKRYHVPAAIEESSVIAAASKAASFWDDRGGFKTIKHNNLKNGQVYFEWNDDVNWLLVNQQNLFQFLTQKVKSLLVNTEKRGGGIHHFEIEQLHDLSASTIKLTVFVNTVDSMGANFINSMLESMANSMEEFALNNGKAKPEIIMSILSNFTPQNFVTIEARTSIDTLTWDKTMKPRDFAEKFVKAVRIADVDVSRAVTHNKGIMNGSDAVILATGNDFRAAEAAVHAYAARSGRYRSLSSAGIDGDEFWMQLTLPIALGTVGGVTKLHPTAAMAFEMLGNPSAHELMKVTAAAGLANNFAAVASLITTGIQKGHMKLHLDNILAAENANKEQRLAAKAFFKDKTVSVNAVRDFMKEFRELV
ncbi:MAG: hydroxymethylglutaryl-CoA reductase, degradative [Salinivirgaceae bacterium]|nr:MAG: hydroxymethylglutaryl-CoA reductase, degradative [Salinivirgaceae bacterium]